MDSDLQEALSILGCDKLRLSCWVEVLFPYLEEILSGFWCWFIFFALFTKQLTLPKY